MFFQVHLLAINLFSEMGDETEVEKHKLIHRELIEALNFKGDGFSLETAIEVINISEEYYYLDLMQIVLGTNDRIRSTIYDKNGDIIDKWTLIDEKRNKRIEVFFNAKHCSLLKYFH